MVGGGGMSVVRGRQSGEMICWYMYFLFQLSQVDNNKEGLDETTKRLAAAFPTLTDSTGQKQAPH
jgi:GTP cyclohydrolase I